MKLCIERNWKKGKFTLKARVELNEEEAELVKTYKANKEILLNRKNIVIPHTGNKISFKLTVGSLIAGHSFKYRDIAEVLEAEKNIKEACESFSKCLEIMNNFGGEEILDYHSNKSRIKRVAETKSV